MSQRSAAAPLLAALKRDNTSLREHSEAYLVALAEMLAEHLGADARRARSLAYNLPRNERLRQALLSGAKTPREVCQMELAELAPDAIKSVRAAQQDRNDARLRGAGSGLLYSRTKAVRCPECGGRDAKFTSTGNDAREWHGRKNEVWGSKHDEDEGPACEIFCNLCEASWHGEAPEVWLEEEEEPQVARRGILGWKGSLRD